MRKDLADITLVVDRSGSMEGCKADAQGGINAFVKDQKEHPGECNFTLVQFDTEYEFVHKGVPVRDVGEYILRPRGNTALLDAVGRAIAEAGERLDKLPDDQKPALVSFVIVTDGHENSSREFTKAKVRESIEHQRSKYNWQFTFIGADATAFDEGMAMGIPYAGIVASSNYTNAYSGSSHKNRMMRTAALAGEQPKAEYTAEERAAMA